MKRFKDILVVLDWNNDNEMLIERGFRLAERNESKLSLVHTFEAPPPEYQGTSSYTKAVNELYQEGIRLKIDQLKQDAVSRNPEGIEIQVSALQGDPALEIMKKVVRESIDLVMIGLEKKEDEQGSPLLGLPFRLMRKCPSAVWAMKPTPAGGFNRIVAAVDPRDQSKEARALNTKIMELASSLAKSEDSELHVLHAWSLFGEELLQGSMDENDLNDWLDREKDKSVRYLKELLEPFQNHVSEIHIHKGPADRLLPLFIKHFKADLLVMGTVCRTGIAGFLIGNTAEKILQNIDCSVLTIKPDSFMGPIK